LAADLERDPSLILPPLATDQTRAGAGDLLAILPMPWGAGGYLTCNTGGATLISQWRGTADPRRARMRRAKTNPDEMKATPGGTTKTHLAGDCGDKPEGKKNVLPDGTTAKGARERQD